MFRHPSPWFNEPLVKESCPSAQFHGSETHVLHKVGGYLKNFGLRTAMIIEVNSDEEAVALQLIGQAAVSSNISGDTPKLQIVYREPDLDALYQISLPLIAYGKTDYDRREASRAVIQLQKQVSRVILTVDDNKDSLSPEFVEYSAAFINSSENEILRIQAHARDEARKASIARKELERELNKYLIKE